MIQDWAGRISYKPGWWLKVEEGADTITLHVGYTGANSRSGGTREISHKREVGRPASFETFVHEAISTFQELENHEAREWFRVDGEHWPSFIPHDPDAIMTPLERGRMRTTGALYDAYQEEKR